MEESVSVPVSSRLRRRHWHEARALWLLVTTLLRISGGDEAVQLRCENGLFSPVSGGKMLRFSGLAASLDAAGQTFQSGLRMQCIFSGKAFEGTGISLTTEASASGQDELLCSTPEASLPHEGRLEIVAGAAVLNSSIPVFFYAVLTIAPTVGMADGLTQLDIHIAGYPPLSDDHQRHVTPACRFDAGAKWCEIVLSCANHLASHSCLSMLMASRAGRPRHTTRSFDSGTVGHEVRQFARRGASSACVSLTLSVIRVL
jgi:hypothetical protein